MQTSNLQGIAASDELNSPFYLKNKTVCEKWEDYLSQFSDNIVGKYSCWALAMKASAYVENLVYTFDITMSTMTNSSIFHVFFKIKEVFPVIIIEVNNLDIFDTSFVIRKKRKRDFLFRKWTSKYHVLKRQLIAINPVMESDDFELLVDHVNELEIGSNLEFIKFNKSKKKMLVKLRSVEPDIEFLDHLMKMGIE